MSKETSYLDDHYLECVHVRIYRKKLKNIQIFNLSKNWQLAYFWIPAEYDFNYILVVVFLVKETSLTKKKPTTILSKLSIINYKF
jgi:hypothetical protein